MTASDSKAGPQAGPQRSGPPPSVLIVGLLTAVALAGSALGWALWSAYRSSGGSSDYQGLDRTLEEGQVSPGDSVEGGVRPASN